MKRIIEWQLYEVKQTELTLKYITIFQFIALKADWNDTAFIAQFYKKLKKMIKNEIACMNHFITL